MTSSTARAKTAKPPTKSNVLPDVAVPSPAMGVGRVLGPADGAGRGAGACCRTPPRPLHPLPGRLGRAQVGDQGTKGSFDVTEPLRQAARGHGKTSADDRATSRATRDAADRPAPWPQRAPGPSLSAPLAGPRPRPTAPPAPRTPAPPAARPGSCEDARARRRHPWPDGRRPRVRSRVPPRCAGGDIGDDDLEGIAARPLEDAEARRPRRFSPSGRRWPGGPRARGRR